MSTRESGYSSDLPDKEWAILDPQAAQIVREHHRPQTLWVSA